MNLLIPSLPKRLRISEQMILDLLFDPVLACELLFGVRLDEFQKLRLRYYWWVPNVMDSSGFSTGKTFVVWLFVNLRCLLLEDQIAGVYYQTFQTGKDEFWKYYERLYAPLFQANVGYAGPEESERKASTREPGCWTCRLKNGSEVQMPAPSHFQGAITQASRRYNTLVVDEFTKAALMNPESVGKQLMGRVTRPSWNQHHPIWGNHILLAATAEDLMHPAAERFLEYRAHIEKRGDPDFATYTGSYKDYSHRKCSTGRTFADQYRIESTLKTMKSGFAGNKSGWLAEGLGIWSRGGKGCYATDSLLRCVELGRQRKLVPCIRRGEKEGDDVHYFLGLDPAPAQGPKSDDGAMVVLRAQPREGVKEPSDNLSDWQLDFVYARSIRKHGNRQYSGLTHKKHQHFKFSGILLDYGAGGGGPDISLELPKSKQLMADESEEVCTPIQPMDALALSGDFILCLFRRGGRTGIEQLWPKEKGDDVIIARAHTSMRELIDHALAAFPPPIQEQPKELVATWDEETVWAQKKLAETLVQLAGMKVATTPDGGYQLTKNGSPTFSSKRKDDLAMAAVYAYVRFLIWLRCNERWSRLSPEARIGLSVFNPQEQFQIGG